MADFKSGARTSSEPKMGPPNAGTARRLSADPGVDGQVARVLDGLFELVGWIFVSRSNGVRLLARRAKASVLG